MKEEEAVEGEDQTIYITIMKRKMQQLAIKMSKKRKDKIKLMRRSA